MSAPLAGRRVVVTRPVEQARALVERLAGLGADVVAVPLIEIVPITASPAIDMALGALDRYDAIVVTSANGADCLADRMDDRAVAFPAGPLVVAVGEATAARMRERGLGVDRIPRQATGSAIARALAADGVAGARILLARAREGRPELTAGLRQAGAIVDDVAFYDTVGVTPSPEAVDRMLAGDMVVLTAPSAVGALGDLIGRERANAIRVVSIGPTTSIAARDAGLTVVAESKEQSVDGLVAAILRSRFPPPPDGEG
jgi:uroporphyrinogen-III synthase